jgi:hypothetical protein
MNLLIKRLIFGLLIMSFFSCGKSNNSGHSTNNTSSYGLDTYSTNQSAINKFKAWYISPSESSFPGVGQKTEERKIKTYSQTDGCESNPINIFGLNIGNLSYCFNNVSPANTQTVKHVINILPTQNKAMNSKLAEIYAGTNMTLITASEFPIQNGNIYQIEFRKQNGQRVYYQVDTSINSAFNPVLIIDTELRTTETLSRIY